MCKGHHRWTYFDSQTSSIEIRQEAILKRKKRKRNEREKRRKEREGERRGEKRREKERC